MKNSSHYDLIGDIHGEIEALRGLLLKLGYYREEGRIIHPEGRRPIFVGDLIDRGPDSRRVVALVRSMVEAGDALAIAGNHEFNFVSYLEPDGEGTWLRPHDERNDNLVAATLASYEGHADELADDVRWMKSLPFSLDLDGLRVVHASWIQEDVDYLADKSMADPEFLRNANRKKSREWRAVENVLKGLEIWLPDGMRIPDAHGYPRPKMRVRWWGSVEGASWDEIAFPSLAGLPEGEARVHRIADLAGYEESAPPVFFGHYKLIGRDPAALAANVACLDHGLGHGGAAVAYRWSGEAAIDPANFVVLEREDFPVYELLIDDNFHYMDEGERYCSGRFGSYEEALAKAERILEGEVENCWKPGQSAETTVGLYKSFGEDPFIRPAPVDRDFYSAWSHAEACAPEIVAKCEAAEDEEEAEEERVDRWDPEEVAFLLAEMSVPALKDAHRRGKEALRAYLAGLVGHSSASDRTPPKLDSEAAAELATAWSEAQGAVTRKLRELSDEEMDAISSTLEELDPSKVLEEEFWGMRPV